LRDLSGILFGSSLGCPAPREIGRPVFGGGCKSRGEAVRTGFMVGFVTLSVACARESVPVQATYDEVTGKLTRLAADLNKDGAMDTWTYMNAATPLRSEQDMDGDGKIERWEFTRPDGSAWKVAVSRRNTGKPDRWTYLDATGEPQRIESASLDPTDSGQEPRIDRIETYASGRLSRVEEDTDADGRIDKWETHEGSTLIAAEFDHNKDGKPDERVTFAAGGKVRGVQKIGR